MKRLIFVSSIVFLGFSVGCASKAKNEDRLVEATQAYEMGEYSKAQRLLDEERRVAEAKMEEGKRDYEKAMATLREMAKSDPARKKP